MIESHASRAPRWVVWGATVLIALGCLLRFANLGQFIAWYDEIATLQHIAAQPEKEIIQSWQDKVQAFADLQQDLATEPRNRAINTIQSLATTDAHHPPLYYLWVRLWADWFGNTIESLRLATVLIGLLLLPSVFWLLRQADDRPGLPWIGTALVALSPLQLLYAQEAREYALWLVFSVLSSGLLLRAMRRSTLKSWLLYTLALILCWYSHLFGGLILLSHGLFVLRQALSLSNLAGRTHWVIVRPWLLSAGATIIAFSPWLWVLGSVAQQSVNALQWLNRTSEGNLNRWAALRSIATVWIDTQPNLLEPFPQRPDALVAVVLLLSVVAIVRLIRSSNRPLKWLLLSLIAPFFVCLWLPGFLGDRALVHTVRYQLPAMIAVQLAVADWLTAQLDQAPSTKKSRSSLWQHPQVWVIGLVLCLLWTNFTSVRARSWQIAWWSKGMGTPVSAVEVTKFLGKLDHPLVISAVQPGQYPAVMSYSVTLKRLNNRTVEFLAITDPEQATWPDRPNVLTIAPSPALRRSIERQRGPLIPTGPSYLRIWRVRPMPTR